MTTVAIMQPTYLPWLGYFDILDQADVFVVLDTVAVSKQSWQTRNRIRARDGNVVWLSVPTNARMGMPLNEVRLANQHGWQTKHWRSITAAYGAALESCAALTWAYALEHWYLATLNSGLIQLLSRALGISTRVIEASTLGPLRADPIHRIADICQQVGATEYLSPAGARNYLEGHDIGVPVRWHSYEHPTYSQGDATFMPYLSVVDLLAWHGPDSLSIIRSGRKDTA